MIETSETKMQNPGNLPVKPDGCVRTIPLDGQNGGSPFYAPFNVWDSATVLARKLDMANAEISRLRTEITRYRASGRVVGTSFCITVDKNSPSGVNIYSINLSNDFKHVCEEIVFIQGLCRTMLKAHTGKDFLHGITAYLAERYLAVSREEVMAKIDRAGDATDSVTIGIRTIRDLFLMYDSEARKFTPKCNAACYLAKINQLAGSMNLKDFEVFAVNFTGEIFTDAGVYCELKATPEFSGKLSQLQLDLQFAAELFCDYPSILSRQADPLINFMAAVEKRMDSVEAINTFRNAITQCMPGETPEKKTPATLDDCACDVLEFCLENGSSNGVSAKAMREHIKDDSKSHFSKTILVPLQDRGFLEATCAARHSSDQRYRITPNGVTALRQARLGRTYPEPIRTDPGTVPGVPGTVPGVPSGKTE